MRWNMVNNYYRHMDTFMHVLSCGYYLNVDAHYACSTRKPVFRQLCPFTEVA